MATETKEISNSADLIDVRDIIERFEELEEEQENLRQSVDEAREEHLAAQDNAESPVRYKETGDTMVAAEKTMDDWSETDGGEEYTRLKSLLNDLSGNGGDHQWRGDWYPVTLIRDSYWEDDCREFAEDMHGEAIRNAAWPMNCIDWTQAANERQMDYSSIEFDDVTYWYR